MKKELYNDPLNPHAFLFEDLSKRLQNRIRKALWAGGKGLQSWSHALDKWVYTDSRYAPHKHGLYRFPPPKKVYVHVHGGVAYCDRVPKGVVVKIIDHDNEGHQ